MASVKTLSPEQVKAKFKRQGITITTWAQQHGYTRHAVYQVLGGFTKANHGTAHKIAVDLGIKAAPETAIN